MNVNICKELCPKLKDKNWQIFLYRLSDMNPYKDSDKTKHDDTFIPIIMNMDSQFGEWICQMEVVNVKNVCVKDLTVHRDCPFYIEHTLFDFNRKENK